MRSWKILNLRGKANFLFFISNLLCAFILAYHKQPGFILNLLVSAICFLAYNYAENSKK